MRSNSFAPACLVLLAEIAMLEPPANTGAGLPSLPGSGKTPNVASFHSRTSVVVPSSFFFSSLKSPIDQCAQPGAMMVAAVGAAPDLSLLMLTHGVESFSVTGAF